MKNKFLKRQEAYNKKREKEYIEKLKLDDEAYKKKLMELYNSTMDRIVREIEADYARFADKEGLAMEEAMRKIEDFDVSKFYKKAEKYVKTKDFSDQANEELRAYNLKMRVSRLDLMKREILLETVDLANKEAKMLEKRLGETVRKEVARQAGILGLSKEMRKNIIKSGSSIIDSSFQGATFSQRIWANNRELRSKLQTGLERSIIQGHHPRKWAKSLEDLVYEDVGKKANYYAERLAITETARIQTEVSKECIKSAGYEKYIWIAEEDDRTCPFCMAKDDEVFTLEGSKIGINLPPLHPHCRCAIASWYED